MFKTETVFVIGAGASCELNFPSGVGLKSEIASYLNIRTDSGRRSGGDDELVDAFSSLDHLGHLSDWFQCSRRVSAGMAISPSIDNYLHTHAGNEMFARCGKIAIVRKILEAERRSPLWGKRGGKVELGDKLIQDSWLPRFGWQLVVDVAKQDASKIFEKLHFIIFNYDRCVETFLYHALQAYYDLSAEKVAHILNGVNFYHPYGTVGRLPWQVGSGSEAEFGFQPDARELLELSRGIRTFTESVEKDEHLSAARAAYLSTRQVLFLGFSFGEQNMRWLKTRVSDSESHARRVYGTSFGVSDDDQNVFKSRIGQSWPSTTPGSEIRLHDLKCFQLFDRYSQSIAGS